MTGTIYHWLNPITDRFQSVTVKLFDGVRLIAEKAMEVRDIHDSEDIWLDYVVDSRTFHAW